MKIEIWDVMKKELNDQFIPCNMSWLARESLKKLKQIDYMREYMIDFSSLILDIQNISEEDKLFNFMSGLQKWAHVELRRQGVKDISMAMVAGEGLIDFHLGGSASSSADKGKSIEGKFSKNKEKDWKTKADRKKENEKEVETTKRKDHVYSKFQGCFICNGPHRTRDCSMKDKVSALVCQEAEYYMDGKGVEIWLDACDGTSQWKEGSSFVGHR
ncbi:hypothetical protein Ddye_005226 [Dipteronia dyeriana]|uniref:Retrotransposon gag domain-containing protein n=1 Tax=Dipteronia dyeriana TaxID=168575 RepID=A0AAE0CQ21_9ROSI|nr:hypothetical protein Ddye_005226 [Dipteronia dyeriana]